MYSYQSEAISGSVIFLLICGGILSIVMIVCFFMACYSLKQTKELTEQQLNQSKTLADRQYLVTLAGLSDDQVQMFRLLREKYKKMYTYNYSAAQFWEEIFTILEKRPYETINKSNTDANSFTT
jgi:biopolymer transport protein ExbB/TolQ